MITRESIKKEITDALKRSRIVALVGPRQCGKTTLAREFVSVDSLEYFDLEDPLSLARLDEPMTGLKDLKGIVVIDEIQRKPDLFEVLRVLCDRNPLPAKFLILGSASPDLINRSSETLTGRIEIIEMQGFSISEAGIDKHMHHWLRGAFRSLFCLIPTVTAIYGGEIISKLFLKEISGLWALVFRQLQCYGSGQCLLISMVRYGMQQSLREA
ncbi:AAA family ATPase [Chitinispirillales bacterium ANBcel5]|nr:AAA family ATPase [Chitinispirillales bacterium ANBcel5]